MLRQLKPITVHASGEVVGPADHGRVMTLAEYRAARGTPGCKYELIDGALVVSPNPVPNHEYWVQFVHRQIRRYLSRQNITGGFVSTGSEIEISGRAAPTRPSPDIAAYLDFPKPPPASWDDVVPVLVVEVISNRRAAKDTVRNRHLYWQVRGLREYWIIDPETAALEPTLIALRRRRGAETWDERVVPFGRSYRSGALPGLSINLKQKTKE
ncbi:MAG: Uma2 family endonuclease [Phycisphaerales bacterium]|nr:Uma2 family endonuclease [Phycisphaerales bacterium]